MILIQSHKPLKASALVVEADQKVAVFFVLQTYEHCAYVEWLFELEDTVDKVQKIRCAKLLDVLSTLNYV